MFDGFKQEQKEVDNIMQTQSQNVGITTRRIRSTQVQVRYSF
jgi:hypothetical protein